MKDLDVISHAADLLESEAHSLRECTTPGGNGDWSGEADAKADFDDLMGTTIGLRTLSADISQKTEQARSAFTRLIASMANHQVETVEADIETVRVFLWTR